MIAFKKKLQILKNVIRLWNSSNYVRLQVDKEFHSSHLVTLDSLIDKGIASKEDV